MNRTKTSLLKSALALLLCVSMLVGSTFAWFTDSVTSKGNIIQSGNLDIEMYWTDDLSSNVWHNVEDTAYNTIFSYDNWEPGYTDVKYIKLVNNGSLALNYKLTLTPQSGVGKLAEVINVFFADHAVDVQGREDLSKLGAIGLLNNVLNGGATANGTLLAKDQQSPLHPSGEVIMTIAMNMITTAGNDYQDKDSGEFTITALATQAAFEKDSFGSDYDNNAEYPTIITGGTVTTQVNAVDGKVPAGGVTMTGNGISAFVPGGIQMADGADALTLSVTPMEHTTSDITVVNNEILIPVDVHISGIAAGNTTPIVIDLGEVLPKYMNMGNYHLYHVENGANSTMTLVNNEADLTEHNRFTYDPLTGAVKVAMASFSEVALVADTTAKWEGEIAEAFSGGTGTEADPYLIANADQLAFFNECISNNNETYGKAQYKLLTDINLNSQEQLFYPIGYRKVGGEIATVDLYDEAPLPIYEIGEQEPASSIADGDDGSVWYTYGGSFKGVFDGNGHTIGNFYQNTWAMKGDYDGHYWNDAMGLFGYVNGGTVKNLTVDNFESDGEFTPTGVIAAYAANATFENIAITNCNPRVYNTGNGGIVGIGGNTADTSDLKLTFTNITIDNTNKISALWGSWDVACGGLMGMFRGNGLVNFTNCHVAAQIDVNNDVCANYQYYWYRYSGMIIGSIRKNVVGDDGYTYPDMTGISASGCTVHFGQWNDYYYCELVNNSIASYTHDYQFSRLEQVDTLPETADGTKHYVKVTKNADGVITNVECRHFINGERHTHDMSGTQVINGKTVAVEDKTCVYLPFDQLFTGYGWGVASKGLKDVENLDLGIKILGREIADSQVKFAIKEDAPKTYRPGQTITVGDLFEAVDNIYISNNSVYVSVSPATENDMVSGTYMADRSDWKNGTITFAENCEGSAMIIITDYFYCNVTVMILNPEQASEKFAPKNIAAQNAYSQITLGDLFSANKALVDGIIATIVDPNGDKTTVNGTANDWTGKVIDLTQDGEWTVAIQDGDSYCETTTTTFTVNSVDKFEKQFTNSYLYRVGNKNPVALSYLFKEVETTVALNDVNVTIANIEGNASGSYTKANTLENGSIQFSGTGAVEVTISAPGANSVTLKLEVVDATNITSATGTTSGGDMVLLCDVNTSTYVNYWNCTLYGNGFTYSLKGAPTAYNSKQGHGILITKNATLDNLQIIGDVYNSYGAYTNQDYYNTAVDVVGDTVIQNCYISGCAAPVSTRANATITNTTLYGGTVANLIIKSGIVTLEDVTTANYDDGRSLVGMGIVIHSDATESAKLVLNGTLTQYNFISESKVPTDTYAKNLHTAMFGDSCSKYHFGTSPNRYVNAGIISLTALFNAEDITDNAKTGYTGAAVTVSSVNGYVYTQPNTSGSVNNNYNKENDAHVATTQGTVAPSYSFDYTTKNYQAKTDGSNDYCYEENGKVNISMDEGDTFNWDTSILTATKLGQTLGYTVSMNGTDYTGKSIAFNTAGDYEVIYTYIDNNNLGLDESGNITTYSKTYTKTVHISVAVIEAATKHAEFTFGSNTASTTVTIGNNTYVMPDVNTTSSTIGSTTVNGQTIYYPIVEIVMSDGKTSHSSAWYAYFPVFNGAVTITDYKDNGLGDSETFGSSTQSMPSGLSIVGDPAQLFKYQSSSTAGTSPVVKNNILVYSSPSISAKRSEYNTVIQYSYQDNAGATYYYYIGYHAPAQSYSSICVTPDTLVTLADGTQKQIQDVSVGDMVVAWNFYTGKYEIVPVSLLQAHSTGVQDVLRLKFEDGTELKILGEHGVYDADLNTFAFIDKDDVKDYIGHRFVKQDGDSFTTVKLVDYEVFTEYTTAYTILSLDHYNVMLEGMFTVTPAHVGDNFFNPFDVNEDMQYNEADVQADIEKYGLYTYEDFDHVLTYEQFTALNLGHFKVSVGKGYITYEGLIYLIENFINNEDFNV